MGERELEGYREQLQQLVVQLGRDDIGLGEVTEAVGKIHFTLARGHHTHQAEMPLEVLKDHHRALAAMMAIVPQLSKAVEQEHIEEASREGGNHG